MKFFAGILTASAFLAASPAAASTTITFDGYSAGYQTNPLVDSGVTFSGPSGLYIDTFLNDGNLQLCSTEGFSCAQPLSVEFASAVSNVSFQLAGDDTASLLSVLLTLADSSTTLATFNPDGNIFSYDTINLASYGNILGFTLTTDDEFGLSYDNFAFSDAVAATPEPATWLMLLLGFGIMGAAIRRRRQNVLA